MMKVFFKDLDYLIELSNGIKTISIESPEYYRKLYFDFFNNVIVSKDDTPMEISKYTLVIPNPLELDLNDKKTLGMLHKKMISNVDDNDRKRIAEIEEQSSILLDSLLCKTGLYTTFNPIIDLTKLFSGFQVEFREIEYTNYLEYLLNYITTNLELSKYKLILTYNLSSILTTDEYLELNKEIEYQDIPLIDISTSKNTQQSTIIVDEDYCVF